MKPNSFFRILSNLLIFSGILIISLTYFPVALQEARYQFIQKPSYQKSQALNQFQEETKIIIQPKEIKPLSLDFSLVIPKIGVNSLVFPNIDSSNEEEYLPVLKKGVAHAKNSALPNQPGVVFIFAHSTDNFFNISHYNAAFFLLNKLDNGDDLYLYYQNKKYHYRTVTKKIVDNEEIPQEIGSISGNALVLQTCWPPGTVLKRLIVIAKLIN